MRKLVLFVKPGLDNFLDPVIEQFTKTFETKKIIVKDNREIDEGMKWADICWFEWCDDLAIYGTKLSLSYEKKIIIRLHSYEAFTYNIHRINWHSVDRIIFVGQPIKDYVLSQIPHVNQNKAVVIENGVNLEKFTYKQREKGFNLAFVGYINYKKGPMLLLHAFKALHDRDPRYKLFIAGANQDKRYTLYFNQMLEEFGLTDAVIIEPWQNDVNQYLENKHYIISSSLFESQHMSVMEGMAKGLKPLVHNFYGAKLIYDPSFVWSSIDEFVEMVLSNEYSPVTYRNYIEQNYSLDSKVNKLNNLMGNISNEISLSVTNENLPKVTVGIINCNYNEYLDQSLQSVLNQNYPNIEIIIIDDSSTDNSKNIIEKYKRDYPNIRAIYHETKTGSPDLVINEIFEQATGDYVLHLSGDDYLLHSNILMNFVKCFLKDESLDYVYGNLMLVDTNGKHLNTWNYRHYSDNELVQTIFHRFGSGVIPMTGLFKRSLFEKYNWVKDEAKPMAGDTLNCLINTKVGWNRLYLNEPFYCHRNYNRNPLNSKSTSVENRVKSMIYLLEYIIKEFNEEIYFPHLNWSELAESERLSLKNFVLGQTYWKMAEDYLTNGFTKHLSEEKKKECVHPIIFKAEEYLNKSLTFGEAYKNQVDALKREIEKIKKHEF
ncbi:glycosyltransferase [Halobacillus massiliensis]|uniref:glycosyltransferase n=1 Tax=Halobacillus massiliensis TaxID=1926286 RepID=UPI0009E30801|nr:glycosyltransferase [Halobacillus massiliensis]